MNNRVVTNTAAKTTHITDEGTEKAQKGMQPRVSAGVLYAQVTLGTSTMVSDRITNKNENQTSRKITDIILDALDEIVKKTDASEENMDLICEIYKNIRS